MPQNVSIQRFRQLTDEIKTVVHNDAVNELHIQAERLKDVIKQVTPVFQGSIGGAISGEVVAGALKESVRAIPGSKDTVVRVVAGGPLTRHTSGTASTYDYARAEEFGTHKEPPHPFFFPTYRLMKKTIITAMKRRLSNRIRQYSAEGSKGNV